MKGSNKKFFIFICILSVVSIVTLIILIRKKPETVVPTPTPTFSPTPLPTNVETLQTIDDFQFAQESKKTYEKYPFLNKLPITNSRYNIVFDFQLEKIRVRLKTVTEAEVKDEIEKVLLEIGVDIKKYPVYYLLGE